MYESLQKKLLKKSLIRGGIMAVIGLVMIVLTARYALGAVLGYSRLEDLHADEVKNKLIEIDLEFNGGAYVSKGETNYYTTIVETRDGAYFISFGVGNNSQIRSAIYDVYKEGPAASVTLYGQIKEMDPQVRRAFENDVQDLVEQIYGVSDFDMDEVIIPYYIAIFNNKSSYDGIGILMFLGGVLLLILAVVNVCKTASGSVLRKLKNDIAAAGVAESTAEADYNAAVSYTKKGDFKIGRQFVYYIRGYVPRAIQSSKLVWAYQITTTHRRNGMKVNTTYSLMIYIYGESGSLNLPMPNDAAVKNILNEIGTRFPWVVTGYTDDLKRMYNKDQAQFLNLRYNTVEHTPVDQ